MAKKNSNKSYSGKSYTVTSKGNKANKEVKKEKATPKKEVKPISLTDTSGVDGYFRPEVAVGRWKLGYEVFMSNFMKMVGINLLMLLFLAPLLILLFLRISTILSNATMSPISSNMGVGYLPHASQLGLEQSIVYYANYNFFMWLPLAAVVLAVGLSGGMYVMRNLCWGESVPVVKTFFKGIKKNVLPMLASIAIYTVVLAVSGILISHIDLTMAITGTTWYYILFKVLLFIVIGYFTLIFMAMMSMVVTYTGNFFSIIKNCFVITTVLLPVNLFFAVFALIPFLLLFLGMQALSLASIVIMFLGASFTMLVWTTYSQWLYDKFLNGRVSKHEATKEEIKSYQDRQVKKEVASKEEGYQEVGKTRSIMDGVQPVTDYDNTIDHLGEYFTAEDLDKLNQSKNKL